MGGKTDIFYVYEHYRNRNKYYRNVAAKIRRKEAQVAANN